METKMAESEQDWIKQRAYALWVEEGYPSGKDTEHWERASLEFAALKPTASAPSAPELPAESAPSAPAKEAPAKAAKSAKPAATGSGKAKKALASEASTEKKSVPVSPAPVPAGKQPSRKRSK
jgi:hypothetical protein